MNQIATAQFIKPHALDIPVTLAVGKQQGTRSVFMLAAKLQPGVREADTQFFVLWLCQVEAFSAGCPGVVIAGSVLLSRQTPMMKGSCTAAGVCHLLPGVDA